MFFSARFLLFICVQHLFPLTSRETWKAIWWIRRGYLGGNENKSTQLSVTSSSLSVTSTKLLWYRIFEMPGREKQRGFCVALSFPPWGFGFLFAGLTWRYPTAAQQPLHGWGWLLTPHLAGAPVWSVLKPLYAPRETKGHYFLISCWKWRTRINLSKKYHFFFLTSILSALEIKCSWWVLTVGLIWTCHCWGANKFSY